MPSIFVWKATTPPTSKKFIRCYSGSNWVLEDNDYSSHSYTYLQQIVIPGFQEDSVITFLMKPMPRDWVGSDLLEVNLVPYQFVRGDHYGTLEHIGNWMRFTLKQDIDFTAARLQEELVRIRQWMTQPAVPSSHPPPRPITHAQHPVRPHHGKPMRPPTQQAIPCPSVCLVGSVSPQQIQQDFQEFYKKFGKMPSQNQERHRSPGHARRRH
jgi:hypothetical protein